MNRLRNVFKSTTGIGRKYLIITELMGQTPTVNVGVNGRR